MQEGGKEIEMSTSLFYYLLNKRPLKAALPPPFNKVNNDVRVGLEFNSLTTIIEVI